MIALAERINLKLALEPIPESGEQDVWSVELIENGKMVFRLFAPGPFPEFPCHVDLNFELSNVSRDVMIHSARFFGPPCGIDHALFDGRGKVPDNGTRFPICLFKGDSLKLRYQVTLSLMHG